MRNYFKGKNALSLGIVIFVLLAIPFSLYIVRLNLENRSKAAPSTNSSDSNSKITGLVLPSVLGFQSDLFSGAANVSYPISVPAGPGGLKPNVALSYSTSSIDDMHTNVQDWSAKYVAQAQLAGLGWNLSGVDSITKGNRGQYYITVGGSSYKLISKAYDGQGKPVSEDWDTSPKGFLRVKHSPFDFGNHEWIVTTKDGTIFTFGNTNESKAWSVETPDPNNPLQQDVVYRWMLSSITDMHNNSVSYTYTQEVSNVFSKDVSCKETGKPYIRSIFPNTISWGENHFSMSFEYENRDDWKIDGSDNNCAQSHYTNKRLKSISVKTDNNLLRQYTLDYKYPTTGINHSLLTTVTQKGLNGQTSLPPYTFDYEGTSNDTYLKWANNGYGGKVTFSYTRTKPLTLGRDGSDKSWYVGTERTRVIKRETDDGMNNKIVTRTIYKDDKTDKEGKLVPQPEPYDPNTGGYIGLGFSDALLGDSTGDFEFLGFGEAKDILYEKNKDGNNPNDIVSMSKKYFYQEATTNAMIGGQSRVMHYPDPRKGKAYKSEVQDKTGKVLTFSEEDWRVNAAPKYNPVDGKQDIDYFPFVYLDNAKNTMFDNNNHPITTKTASRYDEYGNTTLSINYGDINDPTDDKYNQVQYYNIDRPDKYMIGKPRITWMFSGLPESTHTEITRTGYTYDNKAFEQEPTKGDVTQTDNVRTTTNDYPELHITTKTEYDRWGNPVKTWDAKGKMTETKYDDTYHLYPVKITNSLGDTTTTSYNYTLGVPTSVTDINGVTTEFKYDELGRAKKIIKVGDTEAKPSIEYTFKDTLPMVVGTKTKIESGSSQFSDPSQFMESYQFYNGLGQLIQEKTYGPGENQIIVSNTKYDSRGQVPEKSIPYFDFTTTTPMNTYSTPKQTIVTKTEYDDLGRPTKIINTDGTWSTTQYNGLIKTTTNEAGVKKIFESDAIGNLLRVKEFNSTTSTTPYATTEYSYNKILGVMTSTKDTKGNITSIKYDNFGRKMSMTDPDLGTWSYDYDVNGNLKWQKDNKNQTINFEYDDLNRLRFKKLPDGSQVEYIYGQTPFGKGKRVQMKDPSGSTTTEYDNRGRVTKETKVIKIPNNPDQTFITSYTYDNLDRIVTITYPDNEQIKYTYNRAGQPQKLNIVNGQELVTDTTYSAMGQVLNQKYGNNTQTTYSYYFGNDGNPASLRLKGISTSGPGGSLFNKQYSYDQVGNIIKIQDQLNPAETEVFAYDNLNRLLSANTAYQAQYTYDEVGNILTKNEGSDSRILDYSGTGPVHAPKKVNGRQYTYDANGNLKEDEKRLITYDSENRPTEITMKACKEIGTRCTKLNVPNPPLPVCTSCCDGFVSTDMLNGICKGTPGEPINNVHATVIDQTKATINLISIPSPTPSAQGHVVRLMVKNDTDPQPIALEWDPNNCKGNNTPPSASESGKLYCGTTLGSFTLPINISNGAKKIWAVVRNDNESKNGNYWGGTANGWSNPVSFTLEKSPEGPGTDTQVTKTVCATGTAGQNGCEYIGWSGLFQAVQTADSANITTLHVKSGTYTSNASEPIVIQNKTVHIQGDGANSTILDGNGLVGNGITYRNNASGSISKLKITNFGQTGILLEKNSPVTIFSNIITANNKMGIHISDGDNMSSTTTLNNNIIFNNNDSGIYIRHVVNTSNGNNELNLTLNNNVLYANKVAGLWIDGTTGGTGALRLNIKNNIFAKSQKDESGEKGLGILITASSSPGPFAPTEANLSHNFYWQNETACASYFVWCSLNGSLDNVDPKFVSTTDFHLQSSSPAKNAGESTILNPDGTRSDIGAYGGPNACDLDPTLPSCTATPTLVMKKGTNYMQVPANYVHQLPQYLNSTDCQMLSHNRSNWWNSFVVNYQSVEDIRNKLPTVDSTLLLKCTNNFTIGAGINNFLTSSYLLQK